MLLSKLIKLCFWKGHILSCVNYTPLKKIPECFEESICSVQKNLFIISLPYCGSCIRVSQRHKNPSPECSSLPVSSPCLLSQSSLIKTEWMNEKQKLLLATWHLPAMQEIRVRSLGQEDPLEKEMATHSEEPGRLQFTGSQRVGHSWATSLSLGCIRAALMPFSSHDRLSLLISTWFFVLSFM